MLKEIENLAESPRLAWLPWTLVVSSARPENRKGGALARNIWYLLESIARISKLF